MSAAAVRARVVDVVGAALGRDGDLDDDAGLADGTWDSLAHLDVLLSLERAFGFRVDAVLVRELASVGRIVAFVTALEDARYGSPPSSVERG